MLYFNKSQNFPRAIIFMDRIFPEDSEVKIFQIYVTVAKFSDC